MSGRKKPDSVPSYDVGYRKPPLGSRFKPGQSGNPKGRPARAKSGFALLQKALDAPITITEAGEQKTIRQREAVFKMLVAKALKGDPRCLRLLLDKMEQLGLMKIAENELRSLEVRFVSTRKGQSD